MVEGVARAGNGFAQSVGEGEKLDGKVIRMLKGALAVDHGAYTMEIQYQEDEEDDFMMVERVSDSLRVLELDEDNWSDAQINEEPTVSTKTKTTFREKTDVEVPNADGKSRFNHLPAVLAPKLMQTPQKIPPLYPFSRTNVYILISPMAAQGTIKSIILKGSSSEQPFELEIPIEVIPEHGEMIHQLAAKKAIAELEEGRGWLVYAKDEKGIFIREHNSAYFESMVEREAVRLGIQYQIAGKSTSFVATETDPGNPENTVSRKTDIVDEADTSQQVLHPPFSVRRNVSSFGTPNMSGQSAQPSSTPLFRTGGDVSDSFARTPGGLFGGGSGALFDVQSAQRSNTPQFRTEGNVSDSFARTPGGLFGGGSGALFGRQSAQASNTPQGAPINDKEKTADALFDEKGSEAEETNPLQKIIALQTFEGYWNLDAPLLEAVGLSAQHMAPQGVDLKVWAVVLAITFLEGKMAGDKEIWEMLVEKAKGWLKDMEEEGKGLSEDEWRLAKQLIMRAD